MQQLREKLAVAERTAKAEAQMKVRKINFCNHLSLVYVSRTIYKFCCIFDWQPRKDINCASRFWRKSLDHLMATQNLLLKEEARALEFPDVNLLEGQN